jgi:uncharacterized membrane protein YeiH
MSMNLEPLTSLKNMQFVLEQFAVSVAAISGVLAARGKRVDLFGVVVLAVVTAFGGGTVRDLLLGAYPIFWVADPKYLYNALLTAAVMFFLVRYRDLSGTGLLVADAFSLALFSIVGAQKALGYTDAPVVAAAMGVITGVAGGMLRDVLLIEIPMVFRTEIYFYATAALCGSVVFLALNHWHPNSPSNMVVAVILTLLLRLISIKWKLTLPELKHTKEP